MMPMGKALRYVGVTAGMLATLWAVGLILFVATVHGFVEPVIDQEMESVDAIVVLTGGSERISTGLDLLKSGKGKKLLVSGVHQGLNVDRIMGNQNIPQELRDCCVTLGHEATDTMGNADETAAWVKAGGFKSIRLVTSHYHMPRSLLLFNEELKDIRIVPHPVSPDSVKLTDWWTRPGTASLLVMEYNKYIIVVMRAFFTGTL
ncbi:MAG: YdcF family protein [Alphaproteobacteria bacterium]|nr:YdcF family protein [Alphaproteobacteria bacterium]